MGELHGRTAQGKSVPSQHLTLTMVMLQEEVGGVAGRRAKNLISSSLGMFQVCGYLWGFGVFLQNSFSPHIYVVREVGEGYVNS